jgi:hypothetical protein
MGTRLAKDSQSQAARRSAKVLEWLSGLSGDRNSRVSGLWKVVGANEPECNIKLIRKN